MGIFDDVLNSAKTGNFEEVLTKTKTYAEDAAKRAQKGLRFQKRRLNCSIQKQNLSRLTKITADCSMLLSKVMRFHPRSLSR